MELKFGGKLTKGDLLLIHAYGGLQMGIFVGFGRGTIQYYIPTWVINRYQYYKGKGLAPTFHKTYIYGSNTSDRAARITPEILNSEDLNTYLEAIDILKQENIIK
jgi:hypothetical protein